LVGSISIVLRLLLQQVQQNRELGTNRRHRHSGRIVPGVCGSLDPRHPRGGGLRAKRGLFAAIEPSNDRTTWRTNALANERRLTFAPLRRTGVSARPRNARNELQAWFSASARQTVAKDGGTIHFGIVAAHVDSSALRAVAASRRRTVTTQSQLRSLNVTLCHIRTVAAEVDTFAGLVSALRVVAVLVCAGICDFLRHSVIR
jgi:hypothetical protein